MYDALSQPCSSRGFYFTLGIPTKPTEAHVRLLYTHPLATATVAVRPAHPTPRVAQQLKTHAHIFAAESILVSTCSGHMHAASPCTATLRDDVVVHSNTCHCTDNQLPTRLPSLPFPSTDHACITAGCIAHNLPQPSPVTGNCTFEADTDYAPGSGVHATPMAYNFNFNFLDLGGATGTCCSLCAASPSCAAAVWDGSACVFKTQGDLATKVSANNIDARVCVCVCVCACVCVCVCVCVCIGMSM
jgi:hypothetical protein